jgi:hypothetical protein
MENEEIIPAPEPVVETTPEAPVEPEAPATAE